MRFFISEDERKRSGSTAFVEFQKGADDGKCWHIDSISMDEELFSELHLRRFFSKILPEFDYYGITQVTSDDFSRLKENAADFSLDADACMKELDEWVGENRDSEILFTIYGI